jgi:hypothetical protein
MLASVLSEEIFQCHGIELQVIGGGTVLERGLDPTSTFESMGAYLKEHKTPDVDDSFVDDMIADLDNEPHKFLFLVQDPNGTRILSAMCYLRTKTKADRGHT